MNETTFKEIKKDLRTTKNEWVMKTYVFNGETYETKRFNNWFQIFRNVTTGKSIVFPMEQSQKAVIEHLKKYEHEV